MWDIHFLPKPSHLPQIFYHSHVKEFSCANLSTHYIFFSTVKEFLKKLSLILKMFLAGIPSMLRSHWPNTLFHTVNFFVNQSWSTLSGFEAVLFVLSFFNHPYKIRPYGLSTFTTNYLYWIQEVSEFSASKWNHSNQVFINGTFLHDWLPQTNADFLNKNARFETEDFLKISLNVSETGPKSDNYYCEMPYLRCLTRIWIYLYSWTVWQVYCSWLINCSLQSLNSKFNNISS